MQEDKLAVIENRWTAATPGPWYPRATDDERFMNARYVSRKKGPSRVELTGTTECSRGWKLERLYDEQSERWVHDGKRSMILDGEHAVDPEDVIAITLLQTPDFASGGSRFDENTEAIAHAPDDIAWLVVEVKRLRESLYKALYGVTKLAIDAYVKEHPDLLP